MIIEEFDASSGSRKSSPDGLAPPGFDPGEGAVSHTPGPWSIDEIDAGHSAHVLGPSDGFCSDILATLPMQWSESTANARLIAAAPDLYEAARILASLEEAEWLGAGRRTPTKAECEIARAALAKASQAQGQPE